MGTEGEAGQTSRLQGPRSRKKQKGKLGSRSRGHQSQNQNSQTLWPRPWDARAEREAELRARWTREGHGEPPGTGCDQLGRA